MSIIVYSMDELNRLIREGSLPLETPVLNNATGSLNGVMGSLAAGVEFATGGTATHLVMGVIDTQHTPVGNVGAGEDDLMSYTLPANTLDTNGKAIRVLAWGLGNGSDVVTLKVYFGGGLVATLTSGVTLTNWTLVLTIIRTGAATQSASICYLAGTSRQVGFVATPSETLSGTVIVKITGENTTDATNDAISQIAMITELLN